MSLLYILAPFIVNAAVWQSSAIWNTTAQRVLTCPTNSYVIDGFSYTIDSSGTTACATKNIRSCVLGARSCNATGCAPGVAGAFASTFLFLACSPTVPPARSLITINSNGGLLTATCPGSQVVAFGWTMFWTTSWSAQDTCVMANSRACTSGQQQCATTSCTPASGGASVAVVHAVCQTLTPTAPAYQPVSSTSAGAYTTAPVCSSGYVVSYGFITQWTPQFRGPTSCWMAKNIGCNSTASCTPTSCSFGNPAVDPDVSFTAVACEPLSCGAAPTITNGQAPSCPGGTLYGSACTYTCKSGFQISNSITSVTCQASGTWSTLPICSDVNECLQSPSPCDSHTTCTNNVGSFTCSACPAPLTGSGKTGCDYPDACPGPCDSDCISYKGVAYCMPYFDDTTIKYVSGDCSTYVIDQGGYDTGVVDLPFTNGSNCMARGQITLQSPLALLESYTGDYDQYYLGLPDMSKLNSNWNLNPNQIINFTFKVPDAGGVQTLDLYYCAPNNDGSPPASWQTGEVGDNCQFFYGWLRITYPPPVIYPATLRITGQSYTPPASINVPPINVSSLDPVADEIAFTGLNFGDDIANVFVTYGPGHNYYLYSCQVTFVSDTQIRCLTAVGAIGTQNRFVFGCFGGQFSGYGYEAVGSDCYNYVEGTPVMLSVTGCDSGPTTGAFNCPTKGGVQLNITGLNFNKPMSAWVGGAVCAVNSASLTFADGPRWVLCTLPPGTGQGLAIVVQSITQFTQAQRWINYGGPNVTAIYGCTKAGSMELKDCARAGGDAITMIGSNFGADSATVFIGGKLCLNVVHGPLPNSTDTSSFGNYISTLSPHEVIRCVNPSGNGLGLAVIVVQYRGSASAQTPLISYLPCNPGWYASVHMINCSLCPLGRYSDSTGSLECLACPPGQYINRTGAFSCLPCPTGEYRDNSLIDALATAQADNTTTPDVLQALSLCQPCPTGTYGDAPGLDLCLRCDAGRFSDAQGLTGCEDCPPGTANIDTGESVCQNCSLGTSQPFGGRCGCVRCSPGWFSDEEGSSSCQQCQPGTYQVPDGSTQSSCTDCEVGKYQNNPGQIDCSSCARGYFVNTTANLACLPCLIGQYQDKVMQTACQLCQPGTYQFDIGQESCLPCSPGLFGNNSGLTVCLTCGPGTYTRYPGSSTCSACPAGTYSPDSQSSSCQLCDAGRFSTGGKSVCSTCPAGTHQPRTEQQSCELCLPGTFSFPASADCTTCAGSSISTISGAIKCDACPSGATTDKSHTACLCPPGTYSNEVDLVCFACPKGAMCSTYGITISSLGALPGYWRQDVPDLVIYGNRTMTKLINGTNHTVPVAIETIPQQPVFYACLRVQDCLGGLQSTCGNHRTGQLCGTCLPGYRMSVNECQICPPRSKAIIYSVLLLIAALIGIVVMFAIVARADAETVASLKSQANFMQRRTMKEMVGMSDDVHEPSKSHNSFSGNSTRPTMDRGGSSPRSANEMRKASSYYGGGGGGGAVAGGEAGTGGGIGARENSTHLSKTWGGSSSNLNGSGRGPNSTQNLNRLENAVEEARSKANLTFPLKSVLTFFQITTTLASVNTIPWPRGYMSFINTFSFLNIDFIPWQTISCSVQSFDFYVKLIITTATPPAVLLLIVTLFYIPSLFLDWRDMADHDRHRKKRLRHRALFWKLVCFSLFLMYPLLSNTILGYFRCQKVGDVYLLVRDFNVVCYTKKWKTYAIFAGVMIAVYPVGLPVGFLCLLQSKKKLLYTDVATRTSLGFFYDSYVVGMWGFEALEMLHKLVLTSLLQFFSDALRLRIGLIVNGGYIILTLVVAPFIRKSDDRLFMATQACVLNLLLSSFVLQNADPLSIVGDGLLSAVLIAIVCILVVAVVIQLIIFARKLWRLQKRYRLMTAHRAERQKTLNSLQPSREGDDSRAVL